MTNPLGQAVTTGYDPARGLPVSSTDANNIMTTLHYDGLGRLTHVWADGRTTGQTANTVYTYQVSATLPTVATTQQINYLGNQNTSTTLFDALLRQRQTQTPTPQNGRLISDTFYDTRGWVWKTNTGYSDPNSNPGTSIAPVPDNLVHQQNVTDFDGLGRPVRVTSYDESHVMRTTDTAYYGDRTTTVPDLSTAAPPTSGTPTSTVTDALGRTTELDQYTSAPSVSTSTSGDITTVSISGGTTQATDYLYNHQGAPSDIKDASTGQDWSRTYNLLGQTTGSTDPDAGASTMTYDSNGNLTSTTDANHHTITYAYDALNRKTGEYDGPSTSSPPIASWVYDNSNGVAGVTDAVGQLTTETSYSGGNAYVMQQKGFSVYGESGETLTLPPAEGALAGAYTISHTYTSPTGLPNRDYYPASPGGGALPAETVTHGYTATDLPLGTTGLAPYAQTTVYDAYSRVYQVVLGSTTANATLQDAYDLNTGDLTDSQVTNTAVSSTPMDDMSYAYDTAGNITKETDTRSGSTAETQCFSYDELDRLTQAGTATDNCAANPSSNSGSTVGDAVSGSAYWDTWSFSPLGDRTSQDQHSITGGQGTATSYSYNGNGAAQPDTLTSASTTGTSSSSYAYDAAGNTVSETLPSGKQSMTWTDDGKLATDTTTAGTTSYVYDAGGNVLLRKDPGQSTLYVFGEQIVLNTATSAITGTRFLPEPGGVEVVRTGAGSAYSFEFTNQNGSASPLVPA